MLTARGKVHKSLTWKEEVQVCWSQYLIWVLKEIPQNELPIFLPLKTQVNHKYYWDCPIALY